MKDNLVNELGDLVNDCISRQAAIDEIDEWIKAFLENGHKESAADACLIQDGIIQLPSAQPEPSQVARDISTIIENEQDMRVMLKNAQPDVPDTNGGDIIYRQAAIDMIEKYFDGLPIAVHHDMLAMIHRLPSAQPEPLTVNFAREMDRETIERLKDEMKNAPILIMAVNDSSQPEQRWIPVSELPNDNREVEVTCEVRLLSGKKYRYTCHASYVHRYSIESSGYNNWEECDEYNEEEDMYYALPGWYERVHNWDDYSYCAIEDYVLAWRELPEPYKGEQE